MKKAMLLGCAALLLTAAVPAQGQRTIAPGMTTAEVRQTFGAPATVREAGDWTYWHYHNGCAPRCGSDDVVFFQEDRVVAAVLRTSARRFRGPAADDALGAADDGTSGVTSVEPATRVRVGGVRVDAPEAEGRAGVTIVPAPAPADADRPQAREGRPGEASTMTFGGASTVTTGTTGAAGTSGAAGTTGNAGANPPADGDRPNVDGSLPVTDAPAVDADADDASAAADPARNTEATDLNGQTSIDRARDRLERDRQNEQTATERARQNDRRDP